MVEVLVPFRAPVLARLGDATASVERRVLRLDCGSADEPSRHRCGDWAVAGAFAALALCAGFLACFACACACTCKPPARHSDMAVTVNVFAQAFDTLIVRPTAFRARLPEPREPVAPLHS